MKDPVPLSYFVYSPHSFCTDEPWRWLDDGEVMVVGDMYGSSGRPVGFRGEGFNGVGCKWRNGLDEEVVRRKSTDDLLLKLNHGR